MIIMITKLKIIIELNYKFFVDFNVVLETMVIF